MKPGGQNTSSAVMQQRHEADDSLDDFPTPPWATRALFEHVLLPHLVDGTRFGELIGLEPCCNRGYMAKPMAEYFEAVMTSDVNDYGWPGQEQVADFLFPGFQLPMTPAWTFANPPFRLAQEFIAKALSIYSHGCAMLVRTSFQEGGDRYRELFGPNPPTIVAQFAERVIMHKGILRDPAKLYWDPDAKDPKTGKPTGAWKRPSTATSYCWLVWAKKTPRLPPVWIPPCRKQLERDGDYPPAVV